MSVTDPLTIALVIATPGTGWGGMEKHTADLAGALSDRGHAVHVLAHPAYSDCFPESAHLHPLPLQLGRNNLWLKHRLGRTLKSIGPDIVHAQGNKAASLVSAACPKTAVAVGTLHGTKSSHRAFRKLAGVIGVSREITNAASHLNARLIYNGLALPDSSQHKSRNQPDIPATDGQPLLLAAGRLEPVKQFDRLIRAWVNSACGGKLVILGEGRQRPLLESLVRELGMEKRILLPGHQPRILPWLQAATACIISSSREGFPYIMVEALMAGCPVLSTPVSGVRDFLPHTCIARSDNVDDIATLISTRLAEPDLLTAEQHESFQQAREQLSLETMVSKTVAFYQDLLDD
jgi:glycosyltransferase involved in cell wall biosynthesis